MVKHLTASALGFMMISLLAACSSTPVQPPPKIVTETEYVKPPKPIVPQPDAIKLREIDFIVITPENIDEIWGTLKDDQVLIAITPEGYEKIALNLSDLRAFIAQQTKIIAIFESQYD